MDALSNSARSLRVNLTTSGRRILLGVGALLTFLILYGALRPSPPERSMSPKIAPLVVNAPDIQIRLEQASANPPVVRVTLRNTNSKITATILTWDTPFDPQALGLGVFHIRDAETGSELAVPDLKVDRVRPPPRETLLEIESGEEVTREIPLEGPWIPTTRKKVYKIMVTGKWKSLWAKKAADITDKELNDFGGGIAVTGGFKSEEIEMRL